MIEKYADISELQVARNPILYYTFVDITKSITKEQEKELAAIRKEILKEITTLGEKHEALSEAANSFMEESRLNFKSKKNELASLEQTSDLFEQYGNENLNFVVLLANVVGALYNSYAEVFNLTRKLAPPAVMTAKNRHTEFDNYENLNAILSEIQLNGRVLEEYMGTLNALANSSDLGALVGRRIKVVLEKYYKMLLKRHTSDGVLIYKDPVITDVAIRIFENVDSHGEIESGKSKDQVSAYTIRKAEALTKALKDELAFGFISNPDRLIEFVCDALSQIEGFMMRLVTAFEPQIQELYTRILEGHEPNINRSTLKYVISMIKDLNPSTVSYREPSTIKNETDILIDKVKSETLENLVEKLLDENTNFATIVQYVLERKAELKKFFHEENSFYVCKIGEGNTFLGQAPGALYVVPAEKPRANLDTIVGSGFAEAKEFAESIKSSAKWHDLFMATSPSKTADKSNILLIGPMGCGKTEIMRAVASEKDSISVSAQGSDFLTCWKGEAEKNPKRMFEEGIKLSKESGKHVHFLIDEIDSVLNNDRDLSGNNNLTLEFQILMDGIVSYKNISVWGATNNPERIPMPMLRRFNKVLIVGELSQDDRVYLLKHFMGHMPVGNIHDQQWSDWAQKLEGATGDVVRKIADHLWRKKMNAFVKNNPTDAETVVNYLNSKGAFSVDKFDRNEFKQILHKFVHVSPTDVEQSLDENLSNMAVMAEINTAKATYARAKELLKQIKKINVQETEPVE